MNISLSIEELEAWQDKLYTLAEETSQECIVQRCYREIAVLDNCIKEQHDHESTA